MFRTITIFAFALLLFSCSKDNKEDMGDDCDVDNITYASDVKSIIDSRCVSCHGANNPQGGVSLTTSSQVQSAIQNNSLISLVKSGAMPQGQNPLSECQVKVLEAWRDQGYN